MPSYSPVFSQGFIYYTEAAPNQNFDVPAGFTAVVRDISVSCEAGASVFNLVTYNGDGAPGVTEVYLEVTGALVSAHWEGRIVVPGGGTIYLGQYTLGVDGAAYVGGYLLRNSLS